MAAQEATSEDKIIYDSVPLSAVGYFSKPTIKMLATESKSIESGRPYDNTTKSGRAESTVHFNMNSLLKLPEPSSSKRKAQNEKSHEVKRPHTSMGKTSDSDTYGKAIVSQDKRFQSGSGLIRRKIDRNSIIINKTNSKVAVSRFGRTIQPHN